MAIVLIALIVLAILAFIFGCLSEKKLANMGILATIILLILVYVLTVTICIPEILR